MAFGTGSAVAHRAVDAVMGPRGHAAPEAPVAAAEPAQYAGNVASTAEGACSNQMKSFRDVSGDSFDVFLLHVDAKSAVEAADNGVRGWCKAGSYFDS